MSCKAKTKYMFISCYPTDPVLNPDPKLFIDSMRRKEENVFLIHENELKLTD